jgi:RHS repeat-associated protein
VIQTLDGRQLETEYGYDSAGRLIWQEDANNNRTSYEYDKLGRRTVVELPTGERSITTYDEVGNVATVTDFNGETIQFVYDEQNRLETKDLPDDVDILYAYTPDGQIASITDERGTTSFDYDSQGRLSGRRDPAGPYLTSGNSIEYEYDAAGNITEVRTAAGEATYTYDEQNRLATVTEDGETTTYSYDAAGNLAETEFPNGVIKRRTYDELNRLDVLETEKDGILLSRFDYALNDAGHRLEVVESLRQPDGTLTERTVRYEYDDLYRLLSEEVVGGDTTTYTYDDVGNRLSKTVNGVTTTYTYDDNDRLWSELVDGVVVASYTYDNNGNTKSRTVGGVTTNYVWDDQNRMVQVQSPNGETVTYAYDDDNIRVSETIGGTTKSYVLDKNRPYAQVLAEYEDGNLEASYTYGLDLIEQERDGNESYYSVDGLGSTRGLTDENGTVTDTYIYDAFGNVVGSSGSTENDYRFAGEQFDGTLGQYYLRQRYYDPQSGRFTRRDTYEGRLENPVSLHKYIYANADPVNGIDPSGLFTLTMGSDIYAIAGILATLTYIQLSQNSPEQLGGFGEGVPLLAEPFPKPNPEASLLGKLIGLAGGGFGAGPQPDLPTHTGHRRDNTINALIRYIFNVYYEEAYDIAYGHAWRDHRFEFERIGIQNEQELAEHIESVMIGGEEKPNLRRGRHGYWDEATGTLVVFDPNDTDRGTAYIPKDGRIAFENLE